MPLSPVPAVEKIVYSTCSTHAQENESVVRQAIESEEAANGPLILAPRDQVLPLWKRRGLPDFLANSGVPSRRIIPL